MIKPTIQAMVINTTTIRPNRASLLFMNLRTLRLNMEEASFLF
ncbi:hypothetical protein CLOSTASPAR_04977 [[Clostridium] asparagiforme DSM 15981]|uniref:Uncharacterized protein n=1 Tax=[Clostridium] asparagiforme DSM 15981 TaxID=518636 RepID=C0D6T0_9FIRM|nr:hypothetical protein CLOSTASPAR_04977 [[Clostridium] asparagiforme DSM 15981]